MAMDETKSKARQPVKSDGIGETIRVILEALLIAVVIRTFAFQPFNIPSGSLIPTLLVGDYLFVSKYAYGYSKHSFPFSLAPISGRIWGGEPKRGDIVVFRGRADVESARDTDFIKRVIGLPGDRIHVTGGLLHINGAPVKKERDGVIENRDAFGRLVRVPRYRETLPNGVSYNVLEINDDRGYFDNTPEYVVPAGHYFMMGDNRDNSSDSRDQKGMGYIPFENLIGRAEIIFFSIEDGASAWKIWEWPSTVRWNRLFSTIK